jgi:hypothetical protein
MTIIDRLTKDEVISGKLPLIELLDNSFYYPSCGFDGEIIKHYSQHIQSFIYCDYARGEAELINQLETFYGYQLLGHRSVQKIELIPQGWQMQLPPDFDIREYYKYRDVFEKPFAHWAVYERLEKFDDNNGPKKFSLLYIGGEGVATYQALYWANKKTANAVAIIQPGTGSGFNWTDFRDKNGALAWVIMKNLYGTPDTIFYGGIGNGYDDFNWKEYQFEERIQPYYGGKVSDEHEPFGEVTIWKRK